MFRGVDLICRNTKPSQHKLMAVRIIFSKYRVLLSTENWSWQHKLAYSIDKFNSFLSETHLFVHLKMLVMTSHF